MYSMSVLDKLAQSWFYIEYSIYTPKLVLWKKGCQLFRNCIWYVTQNNAFGLGTTTIIEMCKCIDYILDNIFVLLYQWFYDVIVYDVQLLYSG